MIVPDVGHQVLPAGRVQARRGLIQDQHLRLHGQHTCQGHPPFLPAGEFKGGFVHLVVPDSHQTGGLPDTVVQLVPGFSLVGRSEGDVFVNRFFKELVLRILENQSHPEPHLTDFLRLCPDVPTAQENLPLRWF